MKSKTFLYPVSALLAFIVPVFIILSNAGYFLGFADAAEFALVTKIAGIAHAPGFPSYILFGKAWSVLMEVLGIAHIKGMVWFSVCCTAAATLLLFITSYRILQNNYAQLTELTRCSLSLLSAIAFSSGVTAWHWSGNVEVYSFHVLAFAIALYGMVKFNLDKKIKYIYIAAFGISLGLANHHLTMIMFLPFLLFFFSNDVFNKSIPVPALKKTPAKKNEKAQKEKGTSLISILKSKGFLHLVACSFILTALFYGWMFMRAGADLPFKFGNPDSFSRFFYHITGGAWIKNTQTTVKGLIGLRFPYFMKLTFEQFFLFMPFIILGLAELIRRGSRKIIYICVGYYLVVLLYQLRIDQTADTDAYLLPAFFLLSLLVLFGTAWMATKNYYYISILPVLLLLQVYLNFPKTDKRQFNVSETLMREIDRSCPPNSVILIADWTTSIQYYYHRIAEKFRTDLIVLNYDLKFTNYKILPVVYPAFYKEIKPEYDHFIRLLGEAHPQEIYNTGCTLDNPALMNSFLAVISKMKALCSKANTPFMCDPKAFIFLMQNNAVSASSLMSGCFVSSIPTTYGKEFINMDYDWLDSPLLLIEPSATDKMVDLEAALDFSKNYYKYLGDAARLEQTEISYAKIKGLQRKMKLNMPFVFRPQ